MTKKMRLRAYWKRECAKRNIVFPRFASQKKLYEILANYNKTAAVITTTDGLRFQQMDQPNTEYRVYFSISGYQDIRAENEASAGKWIENEAAYYYRPWFGDVVDTWVEVHEVFKAEED